MASDLDVAKKMLSPKWRNIEFPVGPWEMSFEQGQADHLFPDKDGGLIEGTGRNPMIFTFTAYFRNGITNEAITQFPDNWQLFTAACADKSTGTLVHPVLGPIKCKCKSYSAKQDPMIRDGLNVEVSFKESPAADEEISAILGASSPLGSATADARDLDNFLGTMNPEPEMPESLKPSLLDTMKQISGAFSQFKMGIGNIAGTIEATLGGLTDLEANIRKTADPAQTFGPLLKLGRIYDALLQLTLIATPKSKPITMTTVRSSGSLDMVAQSFGMSVDDFGRLNPALGAKPVVKAGAQCFVYAPGAAGINVAR